MQEQKDQEKKRRTNFDYWGFYYEITIETWNCVTFRSGSRLYNAHTWDDLIKQCDDFDEDEQE